MSVGASVAEAVTDFAEFIEDVAGQARAVAYIEIHNFANVDMHSGAAYINLGFNQDHQIPTWITSGSKEAYAIRENHPLTGVEMAANWQISGSALGAIIVNTYQEAAWRPANQLGVCLQPISVTPGQDYLYWKSSKCLSRRQFQKVVSDVQCCDKDYCLQGIMTTSHHSNVTIRLFPRSVKNLADTKYHDLKYQQQLDDILNESQTCYISTGTAVRPVLWLALFLAILIVGY